MAHRAHGRLRGTCVPRSRVASAGAAASHAPGAGACAQEGVAHACRSGRAPTTDVSKARLTIGLYGHADDACRGGHRRDLPLPGSLERIPADDAWGAVYILGGGRSPTRNEGEEHARARPPRPGCATAIGAQDRARAGEQMI
eukprot:scaffold441_cov382-Prasinococcus_capsulatus_cf.AAC.9